MRYTTGVSDEPLEIIRGNECDAREDLATSRFRRLWNEIEAYREQRDRIQRAWEAFIRGTNLYPGSTAEAQAREVDEAIGNFRTTRTKNRVYESMTRLVYEGWSIRVWREEPAHVSGPVREIVQAVGVLLHRIAFAPDVREQIGKAIESCERVSAYEIIDIYGHGSIVYPDWK